MEAFEHLSTSAVCVQFDIVANSVCRKETIYAARLNQVLFNDAIEKNIGFFEDLPRLSTLLLICKDAGINAFQSPGMKERRPIDEFAQLCQRKILKHAHAGKCRCGYIFRTPVDRHAP